MSSIENKVTQLERKIKQLSNDIEIYIAKDREILARLRSGCGPWRAILRTEEFSLSHHPYDEPSLTARKHDTHSATTNGAVVMSRKSSVADERQQMPQCPVQICGRDANSI